MSEQTKFTPFFDYHQSNASYKRMNRVIQLAALSDMRQKHAAILYQGGRVMSVGVNTLRNPPMQSIPYDAISNHAEINCLKGLAITGRFGTLYVARISSGGNISSSRPCRACENYIVKFTNLKEVLFT